DETLGQVGAVRGQEMLARVCRLIGGPEAAAVLRRHIAHRDRDVGLAVMIALGALVSASGADAAPGTPSESVVRPDLEHAVHVLAALIAFRDEPAGTLF